MSAFWTLPILARDSYSDQHIEVETKTAVLVSATDHAGKRVHVAVNKDGYTDFPLVVRGQRVLYDRPEAFSATFRSRVERFFRA